VERRGAVGERAARPAAATRGSESTNIYIWNSHEIYYTYIIHIIIFCMSYTYHLGRSVKRRGAAGARAARPAAATRGSESANICLCFIIYLRYHIHLIHLACVTLGGEWKEGARWGKGRRGRQWRRAARSQPIYVYVL